MEQRTGSADLPLHGGRVPRWLSERMEKLGRVVVETVVLHYGREELLRRLAHPFWFQSFGAVMGMDWHSSGITTSVVGALKRGLEPVADELGLYVCGGRGKHSRRTPEELLRLGERTGLEGSELARASRLVAKVDSAAVQDGFQIYLHSFFLASNGSWVVVQQGMAPQIKTARRYHWRSEGLSDFVEEPHAGIDGRARGEILNLTHRAARHARSAQVQMLEHPDRIVDTWSQLRGHPIQQPLPHLVMPAHHDVRSGDVQLRRLRATLWAAADRGPKDFAELLLQPGIGARTVSTLAAVAEVIHGTPTRFDDPARYSLALGGKDGHPFPVPLDVYDATIGQLRAALEASRLGNDERLEALRRLDRQARLVEEWVEGPSLDTLIRAEREASSSYGGRTVFDRKHAPSPAAGRTASDRPKAPTQSHLVFD